MNNFDLEERCVVYAENLICLCKKISITTLNMRIISQVIGSSGSIGANYCEACEAESKKDFQHKMSIAKKEIKETKHWIRLLANTNPEIKNDLRILWKEAHELLLIFSKSINTSKKLYK
ncbi:MAG: hypothetical protein US83_C0004G0008 [Candidatus Falkowbacteria bacterium GW2011_GWC2_38_22]|uniref:Four helix bundle protein n=1 Tax=Candidatus Falkowbacteria bacterium GW2011_GWE1_38_31 TaxID=1618638 RepID=A0A0G0MA75_9BACT|nr:MAG: hypothetical protein US73_C0002G0109 [Candidatus Falkowbacteria bacterium GW2011_GWF2_38_1205]KKQ61624.1 MAG: hypothetical protein US83_C0004G0008 [Candidatus Falkowbacteria bacterium GW2011_GWC2_38_22]KKQ63761.1 MAG: hypothetical protein US84_C0004G0109 [Candidatus Falkowbacteria bacterium GW2011_GWF1_38_22]KKQ65823.1 MAG: hypothetical protein US87_C0004G0008 [Candidatus Falkowbacteria bacterium GW2011_GWE2_38_254]KKQ70624.1 MAG: hypothetical protein US91_C0004G0109 [Candidatus Falkowb